MSVPVTSCDVCEAAVEPKNVFTVRHFTVCSLLCLKTMRETKLKQTENDLARKRDALGRIPNFGGRGSA